MVTHQLLIVVSNYFVCYYQGGHSTGKTGNLDVGFSRQGKPREFSYNMGKNRMLYSYILRFCFKNMNINIVLVAFVFFMLLSHR